MYINYKKIVHGSQNQTSACHSEKQSASVIQRSEATKNLDSSLRSDAVQSIAKG